ncbi:MAG: ClbS/DfsB family four-helix bundle protein [Clostridiales bacterium]|jgi:hypothetical protein|nr:ClbS/DfsB family four-helix bundle protein [Clostridiales bacterium]
MPRPTTKTALIAAANGQFDKLWTLIDTLSDVELHANFKFDSSAGKESHWGRDKNMRDVLVHLFEWHQLFINFVVANQNDENKPFLPEPYNWKTYPEMNVHFWEKHKNTAYDDAAAMLRDSHSKVVMLIEGFSDDELFEKKHFAWTGTTNLGSYCISVTSSHYDWAIKKIKLHIKTSRDGAR